MQLFGRRSETLLARISGPILDRIDIMIEAPRVGIRQLSANVKNESSYNIRARVMEARERQKIRYQGSNSTLMQN